MDQAPELEEPQHGEAPSPEYTKAGAAMQDFGIASYRPFGTGLAGFPLERTLPDGEPNPGFGFLSHATD